MADLVLPSATITPTSLELDENITEEQYLDIGRKLALIESSSQWWIGDWLNKGRNEYGELKERCERVGINYKAGKNYSWVCSSVTQSLRSDHLTFSHHQLVASMDEDEQQEWLSKADGMTTGKFRAEIRKARLGNVPSIDGIHRIVYADPPWDYGNRGLDDYGHADRHYTSMTIEELCAMDVKGHVEDDAVLFMWVTSPLLDECWPVITAWGFEYKTSFVWDKVKHNHGHYNSVRHEMLLICTRGSCTPEVSKLFDSVVSVERSDKHSEKPQEFYDIIETLYPSGSRIELFARNKRDGWETWGNE